MTSATALTATLGMLGPRWQCAEQSERLLAAGSRLEQTAAQYGPPRPSGSLRRSRNARCHGRDRRRADVVLATASDGRSRYSERSSSASASSPLPSSQGLARV